MAERFFKGRLKSVEIGGHPGHSEVVGYNDQYGYEEREYVSKNYSYNAKFSVEVTYHDKEGKKVTEKSNKVVRDIRDLPRELRVTDKQRTVVGLIAPVINKLYEEKYSESNHEFELIHRKDNDVNIWALGEVEKDTIGKLIFGIHRYFDVRGWTENELIDIARKIVENEDDYIHNITTYLKGKGVEY